jgi:hypothetical protein
MAGMVCLAWTDSVHASGRRIRSVPARPLQCASVAASEQAAGESAAGTAEMAPAEPTAYMSAATERATVSTHTTESIPITACGGERKRVSCQSPGESRSRSQNDHGLTQHRMYSFGRDRASENIVISIRPNRTITPNKT